MPYYSVLPETLPLNAIVLLQADDGEYFLATVATSGSKGYTFNVYDNHSSATWLVGITHDAIANAYRAGMPIITDVATDANYNPAPTGGYFRLFNWRSFKYNALPMPEIVAEYVIGTVV